MPEGKLFVAQSGNYSFVVKQFGDKNLHWFNAIRGLENVKAAVKADRESDKPLSMVKYEIHDPNGKMHLEGVVGFYDTEVLEALQDCPH